MLTKNATEVIQKGPDIDHKISRLVSSNRTAGGRRRSIARKWARRASGKSSCGWSTRMW